MASLLSLFGVILWSLAAFRPLGETLGTLPSHRSEVVSYYVECLLRASHGHVRPLLAAEPLGHGQQASGGGGKGADLFAHLPTESGKHQTDHHDLLVHIQSRAARIQHLHPHCSLAFLSAILTPDQEWSAARGA